MIVIIMIKIRKTNRYGIWRYDDDNDSGINDSNNEDIENAINYGNDDSNTINEWFNYN